MVHEIIGKKIPNALDVEEDTLRFRHPCLSDSDLFRAQEKPSKETRSSEKRPCAQISSKTLSASLSDLTPFNRHAPSCSPVPRLLSYVGARAPGREERDPQRCGQVLRPHPETRGAIQGGFERSHQALDAIPGAVKRGGGRIGDLCGVPHTLPQGSPPGKNMGCQK
ncbi:hypothetical protein TNIN_290921 [Trichonephila inaurata madagascariensis]|uniref:Uncharacterized protein n=1 Tax=Trichonephila inaurata madagascariensis TaxID=2747483 RepID=A0A8X6XDA7_9ARAC|nr:hypothetical protein TNIN_290921 [Trichonephila inaurata madagascariensis]